MRCIASVYPTHHAETGDRSSFLGSRFPGPVLSHVFQTVGTERQERLPWMDGPYLELELP